MIDWLDTAAGSSERKMVQTLPRNDCVRGKRIGEKHFLCPDKFRAVTKSIKLPTAPMELWVVPERKLVLNGQADELDASIHNDGF